MTEGQTTIEPCAICGEPAERQVEITPAVYKVRGGERELVKKPTYRHICAHHATRIEEQAGWQDREKARRKQQRAELKAAQADATLFDAGPATTRGRAA